MAKLSSQEYFLPRFFLAESRLIKLFLNEKRNRDASLFVQFAKVYNLKQTAVARAAINGFIAVNPSDVFSLTAANGQVISFSVAARVVRQFNLAHAKATRPLWAKFQSACKRIVAAKAAKKAAATAEARRVSCKKILRGLDADATCPKWHEKAILEMAAEDRARRAQWSDFLRFIKAQKKEERASRALVGSYREEPKVAPIRVPYVCPLGTLTVERTVALPTSSPCERARSLTRPAGRMVRQAPTPFGASEYEALIGEYEGLCLRASRLDLCLEVQVMFAEAVHLATSESQLSKLAHLATLVCTYFEKFPCGPYFNQLADLASNFSEARLDQAILGLEREIAHIKNITLNDQAANGILTFVAGAAAGSAGLVLGGAKIFSNTAKDIIDYGVTACDRISAKFVDTVGQATERFGETIFSVIRKQFDAILGPYLSTLNHARALIDNYWQSIKSWATKMWSSLAIEVQGLFESTWWALALILCSGVVYLVERLLVSLGILTSAGSLVGIFLTGFMLHLGWKLGGDQDSYLDITAKTIRALVHCILGKSFEHSPDNDLVANASNFLEFPLHVLETLGTGLISAPLGTLQYAGRYGQALDQIRKGKDALKEFIGWCFDRIADSWDYVSGRKDSFFREIASMTKVPIVPWIERSQRIILEAQTVSVTDPVLMDNVTHLLHQGQILQTTLAGANRSTSLDYGRLISSLMTELMKVRVQCARAGVFEGRRCEPFWVYIYGPSHCGKSLFMEEVTRRLLKDNGHAPNDIYAKNARDSYWSGYLRQAAVQIDDLSACITEPSVESEFMQLVGSKEYKLNMAAVEDKGMAFNSSLIITTSNVFTAPTDAKILDKIAYNNRRGAVVQCRRSKNCNFDPRNPSASCEARLVTIEDESPLTEWTNCTRTLEDISVLNRDHRMKELALMANYRERSETLHPIYHGAKSFLKKACSEACFGSSIMCDNVVYFVDKSKGTCEATTLTPDAGGDWEAMKAIQEATAFVSLDACSGMLNTFLRTLVEGPCAVESVSSLNSNATDSQRSFFRDLPLLERVYLRLVQKRIDAIKDIPELAYGVEIRVQILSFLAKGYRTVCANGGKILTVAMAVVLIFLIYSTFFSLFASFIAGNTGGAAAIATMGALSANAGSVSSIYSNSDKSSCYSSRNIPVQYRNVSGMDLFANAKGKGDEFLMSHLAWLEIPGGGLISCIRGKGRFLYLTKHQAEQIPDGARVDAVYMNKNGDASTIRLVWKNTSIREYSGTEAVTYHDSCLAPMPEPSKAAFDVDIDALPSLFDINVVVVKRKSNLRQVDPSFEALPAEQPIIDRWSSNAKLCREMQGFNTFAYGGTYRNEIPISVISKCPTYAEDCGAILTTMWKGQRRIIGMHVASGFKRGYSKDWTSTATLLPTITDITLDSSIKMVEEVGVVYPGYRKIGWIPHVADRPYIAGRTAFEPVPEELKFVPKGLVEKFEDGTTKEVVVEIKQPAILTADDPRIPEGMQYDPLKNGMEKFKQPMELLDDALCAELAQDIAETWYDCFSGLEDVSEDVAINGAEDEFFDKFNMTTSEGYPWVKHRGIGETGKIRYFEPNGVGGLQLREDTPVFKAYNDLQLVSATSVPELVCIETPKDECLPLRKITGKPKTRLFSILPLEFNLLLRKKFLSFAASLQANRDKLPTQVGINPHSREWAHIFQRLRSQNSVAINCDYSSFDGLITGQILKHIGNAINFVYKDDSASKLQRHNLLMSIVNRRSICGSQVYEVSAGIPSGCALTVLLNSIFNELLIRYVWKISIGGIARESFSRYVTLIVYGDDNLIAVHPDFLPHFNGMIIQEKLANVGVTITDGSDKTAIGIYEKPFNKLDFLKRRFVKQFDGKIFAPLDLASIYTSLQNVTLGAGSIPEAVRINVHTALSELYVHQNPVWFNDLRDFYVKKQGWNHLLTWAEARAWHYEQLTGVQPWTPHRLLDIPLDTEKLKKGMENQGESTFCAQVCDRIFVCGPSFNTSPLEKAFVVSHTGFMKKNETGLLVPVDFVHEGRGRLPTQLWVKKFRSSSNLNTSKLRDYYGKGYSLYFRGDPPFISNWASATSFALGVGQDYQAILNLYHNVCTPDAQSLNIYFENERFKRVKGSAAVSGIINNRNLSYGGSQIYLATTNKVKMADIQAALPLVSVQTIDCELEERDDQPSCSKCMEVKLQSAKERVGKYPLLVEDSGYAVQGYPGAMFKPVSKRNPEWFREHIGKECVSINCAGLLCSPECPGHVLERTRDGVVTDAVRDDLYGWEKYTLYDGQYSDAVPRSRSSARAQVVQAVLGRRCSYTIGS